MGLTTGFRRACAAIGGVVVLGIIGAPAFAASATVTMTDDNGRFSPSTVTIRAGDSVTWKYVGDGSNVTYIYHSVKSSPSSAESFRSDPSGKCARSHYEGCFGPEKGPNIQSFSHTFSKVGSFAYSCEIHGSAMSGTVVVQAAATPRPPAPTPPPAQPAAQPPAATIEGEGTPPPSETVTAEIPTPTPDLGTATPLAIETSSGSNTAATVGITLAAVAVLGAAVGLGYTMARRRRPV